MIVFRAKSRREQHMRAPDLATMALESAVDVGAS